MKESLELLQLMANNPMIGSVEKANTGSQETPATT
jgi:hypothetical protein